jgi:hypothetical protein
MSTATKRIAWKENYLLRPIVLASLALFLISATLVCFTVAAGRNQQAGELLLGMFVLFGCVIGLATGIILFVPERETETDLFLGRLPVRGIDVSKTKLKQGLIWFSLFLVVTAVATIGIFQFWYGDNILSLRTLTSTYYTMCVLIPIECFLWSVVCSLKFRGSVSAVITAAIACVVSLVVVPPFLLMFYGNRHLSQRHEDSIYLAIQVVLIVGLATFAIRSARTWLRGFEGNFADVSQVASKTLFSTDESSAVELAKPAHLWASMAWQNFRVQALPFGLIAAGTLIAATGIAMGFWQEIASMTWRWIDIGIAYWNVTIVNAGIVLAGAAVGLLTFTSDQSKESFLFFQQRADYPRKLWLSRMAAIGLMVPVIILTGLIVYSPMTAGPWILNSHFASQGGTDSMRDWSWISSSCTVTNCFWVFLVAASVAQLLSLLIRHGMIAFFVICAAGWFVWQYCNYLMLLGEPLWLFAAPIAVVAFAASWWFAPRWIGQRKVKRGMVLCFVGLFGVIGGSIYAMLHHRANAFAEPSAFESYKVTFDGYGRGEGSIETKYETVKKLKAAFAKFTPASELLDQKGLQWRSLNKESSNVGIVESWPEDFRQAYMDVNKESLALIREAVADVDSCHFLNPFSSVEREAQASQIDSALRVDAYHAMANKDIENALNAMVARVQANWNTGTINGSDLGFAIESLIAWSELPNQTPESIRNGIDKLDQLKDMVFNGDNQRPIREHFYRIQRLYGSTDRDSVLLNPNRYSNYSWLEINPWERQRSRRIDLRDLKRVYSARWEMLCELVRENKVYTYGYDVASDLNGRSVFFADHMTISQRQDPLLFVSDVLTSFSYTKVRMALAGYRCENGSYPESLELLLGDKNGFWLKQMPVSLGTGKAFAYFPNGLDEVSFFESVPVRYVGGLKLPIEYRAFSASETIPAKTPFLLPWSGELLEKRSLTIEKKFDEKGQVGEQKAEDFWKNRTAWWLPRPRVELRISTYYQSPENWILP